PAGPVVVRHPSRLASKPSDHPCGFLAAGRARRSRAFDVRRDGGRDEESEEDQDASGHRRLENGLRDRGTVRSEARSPALLRRIIAHDTEKRGEGERQVPRANEAHGFPPLRASREFVLKEISITEFIACHPRCVPSTFCVLCE